MLLLLSGCGLPIPLDEGASSPYPGAGSGYTGAYGRDHVEYRGSLPSGSYTETCREMRVDHDPNRLEAECQRLDGRWRDTALDLRQCDRNIVNNDGSLACRRQTETVRLPPGSYRESCRDFSVENGRLGARCRRKNDWRDTAIDLSGCQKPILNDDGRLVCT
jgi:CVNH domain